jgi:quercetin dioxygenase-like cupin family protein
MPKKKEDSIAQVGKKIHKVRETKKVSLDQIANETGFSIDYLKKIEAGKVFPPVGALLQIAKALEIDSGYFLREQESTLSKRIKAYTERTENYAYTTLTPGAGNKHLKAFKVTVEPLQNHKGVGYHHEGEEFVYVLQGKVEVVVGDHANTLDEGDSLHFNSGIRHMLKNVGEEKAKILIAIYVP